VMLSLVKDLRFEDKDKDLKSEDKDVQEFLNWSSRTRARTFLEVDNTGLQ